MTSLFPKELVCQSERFFFTLKSDMVIEERFAIFFPVVANREQFEVSVWIGRGTDREIEGK